MTAYRSRPRDFAYLAWITLFALMLLACGHGRREYFTGHIISCWQDHEVTVLSPDGKVHVIDTHDVVDAPRCDIYGIPGVGWAFSIHYDFNGYVDNITAKATP